MSNLKIDGVLFKVFEKVQITDKFSKREFILECGDKYKEYIKFQLTNNNCDLIGMDEEGHNVTVHFNLRGKAYEKNGVTSYFTNLEAWKIEREQASSEPIMVRKSLTKEELKLAIAYNNESEESNNDNEERLPF